VKELFVKAVILYCSEKNRQTGKEPVQVFPHHEEVAMKETHSYNNFSCLQYCCPLTMYLFCRTETSIKKEILQTLIKIFSNFQIEYKNKRAKD